MKRIANYIDGKLQAPLEGKYLPLYDPSKGEVYGEVPASNGEDVVLIKQLLEDYDLECTIGKAS